MQMEAVGVGIALVHHTGCRENAGMYVDGLCDIIFFPKAYREGVAFQVSSLSKKAAQGKHPLGMIVVLALCGTLNKGGHLVGNPLFIHSCTVLDLPLTGELAGAGDCGAAGGCCTAMPCCCCWLGCSACCTWAWPWPL